MANELENFRRQIDALDDQIIKLLKERLDVVARVGDHKRETAPDFFPIRPGREAKMLRRIAEAFKDSGFSAAAAAQIWRTIIGTSTALEAKLTISVYAPEDSQDYYWLTREYFGPAASIIKQPHVKRVIGDVMDGVAAVGVVPKFSRDDTDFLWLHLIQPAPSAPKIFAHLPFVYTHENPTTFPAALAFSRLMPEDSGQDLSLYILAVDHDVSQHKLQSVFVAEKLTANWLGIAMLSANSRHHLIEITGFIAPDNKAFKKCIETLGANVQQVHFLGSYATPFTIKA